MRVWVRGCVSMRPDFVSVVAKVSGSTRHRERPHHAARTRTMSGARAKALGNMIPYPKKITAGGTGGRTCTGRGEKVALQKLCEI